jgi:hypothetical protein
VSLSQVQTLSSSILNVNWIAATDDNTPSSQLTYEIHAVEGNNPAFTPSTNTLKFSGQNITSTQLSNLKASTEYTVKLVVADAQWLKTTSNSLTVTTQSSPNQAPENVSLITIQAASSTAANVSWSAAIDDHTPINQLMYEVHAVEGNNPAFTPSTNTLKFSGQNVTSTQLSNLKASTVYTVKLVVADAQGLKTISGSMSVTTTGLPKVAVVTPNVVQVEYESLFDVFSQLDPVNYPNVRIQPDNWDYGKLLSDLNANIDIDNYDFVLVYTSQEVPGWINAGAAFEVPNAKNIGLDNNKVGLRWGQWKRLKRATHMNWVGFMNPTDLPQELTAIHEIGHHWGQYMIKQDTVGPRNWLDGRDPLAYLAGGYFHWSYAFFLGQNTDMPGIMYSGATSPKFNPFDLYNMGLMGYSEVSGYSYLVAPELVSPSTIYKFYEININTLIDGMRASQPNNVLGDGRRIPDRDSSMEKLSTLVVLVKGKNDIISPEQLKLIKDLAEKLPAAWETATWGRSKMDVSIHVK